MAAIKLTLRSGEPYWVMPSNVASMMDTKDKEGKYTSLELYTGVIAVQESAELINRLITQIDYQFTLLGRTAVSIEDIMDSGIYLGLGKYDPMHMIRKSTGRIIEPVGD